MGHLAGAAAFSAWLWSGFHQWRCGVVIGHCSSYASRMCARRPLGLQSLAIILFLLGAGAASATECVDAEVFARVAKETPTLAGDCGDDCTVVAWPWIIDLQVQRVYRGDLQRGPLTVLAIQHTDRRPDRRSHRWLLRRNTLGNFNIVQAEAGERLPPCPVDAPPARPFIQPGDGTTLDDLKREGQAYYGRDSH